MPNNISKRMLVAVLASLAVAITAGSVIYQANAQTDDQEPKKDRIFFQKSVFHGDVVEYVDLDIDGSVNITEQVADQILAGAKIEFAEAAVTAADAVNDGKVIGGNLGVINGFLVYSFRVVDDNSGIYFVIVDAGDGKVLHTSDPVESMPEAVVGSIMGGPGGSFPFHSMRSGIAAQEFEEPVDEG